MYAVIETGGKQYRVELGTTLEVDRLDAEPGSTLTIDRVLLVADGDIAAIGRPTVETAVVAAEVVGGTRGDKVISFKYRPKARRRVKKGHRSELTVLRITDIRLDGRSAATEDERAAETKKTERQRLEEAAARQAEADAALARQLAERSKAEAAVESTEPAPAPAKKPRASRATAKKPAAAATTPAAAEEAPTEVDAAAPAPDEAPAAEAKPKRTRRPKATTEE